MVRVALTGGIACGKSLVAEMLRERGFETLDADDVVHELLPEGERRRLVAEGVFRDAA
ncbi:MAG: dephospho-CoA kinase, partial [Kiritimatiellae bacterium]|nr:dephospho-CoA kinase [Kiritimatiellia bacterium]